MAGLINPFGSYQGLLAANKDATIAGNSVLDMYRNSKLHRDQRGMWEGLQEDLQMAGMAPVPIASDIAGLAGDAMMYYREPESRNWWNFAGSALGAVPFVPSGTGGAIREIFAGRKAATAIPEALDMAKRLEDAGLDARTIKLRTFDKYGQGWFKGPDGQWRFEISDADMRINPPHTGTGRLGDVTSGHEEVFRAYPELRDIMTRVDDAAEKGGGYSPPQLGGAIPPSISARGPTHGARRLAILHEMQHAIQEIEGFAQGGNKAMFDQAIDREYLKFRQSIFNDWEDLQRGIREKTLSPNEIRARKLKIANDKAMAKQLYDQTAEQKYLRLAGEVEARLVEQRSMMTPLEQMAFEIDYGQPYGYDVNPDIWTKRGQR